MVTAPYEAASLRRLRDTLNRRWPDRDKRSDGWIGDAAHQARVSDHNPDPPSMVVRARDVDKDGVHVPSVLGAALAHPATAYVIHNRRIWSRRVSFRPAAYEGSNPHTGHIHVSILHTLAAEESGAVWYPLAGTTTVRFVAGGGQGQPVRQVQAWLNGHGYALAVDGDFGARTEAAVKAFQRRAGIVVDGIVGPVTRARLGSVSSSW
jgi:murein L,D-transpeptidase YcbB/YkuD